MYLWYIVHHSINSLEKETPLSSPGEATAKEQLTNCFSKRRSTDHREFKGISALTVNNFIVKNFYKISKCLYWSEGFEGFQISRFERFQANMHSVINPLSLGTTEMSHILEQTCSWKLQFCLSMYDILVDTRH